MTTHIQFLLLGLANGAVFASLALALVLTYRSSGVVNFATGVVALLTAYLYAFLRTGQLVLFIPGLPKTISVGGPMAFWPAAVISVAVACLLGLLLYALIFRPLRTAPPVAKAVASIGVMVIMTGIILERMGTNPVSVDPIFPNGTITIGSAHVSKDRLWFAVTVIAIAALLTIAYRFTRFGLHTRAAAETKKGAHVTGISPDRIAALNWMIGAGMAGLAGILIAPIAPLVPYSYTLFIVPALAAAIVGGFDKIWLAVAAGLAIGMLQSELTYLAAVHTWLPSSGGPELIPLVMILVVLVLRARPLPSRGAVVESSLGRAPRPTRILTPTVLAVALGFVAVVVTHRSWRAAVVTSFIFGIISLSLVVVTGYAGQVSLAQLTLAGVGGFLVAGLSAGWGVPFPIAPILAALGATVVGVVVGLPALRVRGLPVAVVTLSLAVAVQALWFTNTSFVGVSGRTVKQPSLFGIDLSPGRGAAFPRLPFCVMVLVTLTLVALGVAKLRTSRLGGAMVAVRANERSASAAGINVVRTKLAAFAIGAFIAGLGGSLLGYKLGTVTFDSFDVILGLGLFATVYVAGITSVSGGLLAGVIGFGGFLFFAITQAFSVDQYWFEIVTGIGLVLSVILNPEGIVGPVNRLVGHLIRRPPAPASRPSERAAVELRVRSPSTPSDTTVLSVQDIGVTYGGVVAVAHVSFDVPQHSIIGLIGPNGAGKTTLVDAITGFTPCQGSLELDGRLLDGRAPHQRVRAGLGRTFQGQELWADLSVAENVLVGHGAAARTPAELDELFALLELSDVRSRLAGELSQGQRQMVSIARSLVRAPTVLLLDEPGAGLDATESVWLADRLREIRDGGVTIVLIDHDMDLVLGVCDRVEVLDLGRIIASDAPAAIRINPLVMEAYLGDADVPASASVPAMPDGRTLVP